MARRITGAASLLFLTIEHRDMALHVRVAPCLLKEPAQGVLNRTVPSVPGSPALAAERVERVCRQRLLAHVPIIALPQSTRGARAQRLAKHQAATPWPSSIAHFAPVLSVTCAWPSSTCQCQVRPH